MACKPGGVDLHVHSTASDGTLTPAEILHLAVGLNLGAIALTDHDTLDGVKAAVRQTIPETLAFVSGVEISAAALPGFPQAGSLHILGYGFEVEHPDLNAALRQAQSARCNRNPRIIQRLNQLGVNISMAEVLQLVPESQAGRPHIAQLMVSRGLAASIDDAFQRFLGVGRPAYIDKHRIACTDALALLQAAGGIAVLAHPGLVQRGHPARFEELLKSLTDQGLDGIEVWYPQHTRQQTAFYSRMAQTYNLVATGGTDFHGGLKPGLQLGYAQGDFCVPCHVYDDLMARIASARICRAPA